MPEQTAARQSDTIAPRSSSRWLSLRTKGLLAFAAFIIYCVIVGAFVLHQKDAVLERVAELQRIYKLEELASELNSAVFHTLIAAEIVTQSGTDFRDIDRIYSQVEESYTELANEAPDKVPNKHVLEYSFLRAKQNPNRANMMFFGKALKEMAVQLTELTSQSQERESELTKEYQITSDSVVMTALVFGLLGLVLFGAIISLFFTRLTADLQTLQDRAIEIVKGYRGAPMPVFRHDEVGELMHAVNRMAAELEEHEKQHAIERQKYIHREKMAAVGSLAASVAHEIGNPISAISGIVQSIQDGHSNPGEAYSRELLLSQISLIQSQITRLTGIIREISNFATPRAAERELNDLNGLIRTTANLVSYDKRFRSIELKLNLDSQLPAIYCVGDQVIQVVMNLLINAADALNLAHSFSPRITVTTSMANDHACITVEDSGCGMDEETLKRATEAFFTTKDVGKGSGLGLALCKSVTDSHGGVMEIDSQPNVGTRVRILLPVSAEEERMIA